MSRFKIGNYVLKSTGGLRDTLANDLGVSKLAPRFIGPFRVLKVIGDAYTLEIISPLRLHPTFYVGRLKEYRPATLHGMATLKNAGSHIS